MYTETVAVHRTTIARCVQTRNVLLASVRPTEGKNGFTQTLVVHRSAQPTQNQLDLPDGQNFVKWRRQTEHRCQSEARGSGYNLCEKRLHPNSLMSSVT